MKAHLFSTATRFSTAPTRASKAGASMERRLTGRETFSAHGRAAGLRIEVLEGLLWVTQAGDRTDYLLGAGESFVADRPGQVVAQTVTPASRFVFTPARA